MSSPCIPSELLDLPQEFWAAFARWRAHVQAAGGGHVQLRLDEAPGKPSEWEFTGATRRGRSRKPHTLAES